MIYIQESIYVSDLNVFELCLYNCAKVEGQFQEVWGYYGSFSL